MTQPPRLAPSDGDDWDDETRALVEGSGRLNIFTTLAHHPKLLKRWLVFGAHVLGKNTLPERERELVILRTGWLCGSSYEFGQHTIMGRAAGLTDDEIRATTREHLDGWSPDDTVLLAATDQLVVDHDLDDDTWTQLAARWSTQQVLDLIFTVGQYVLVSTALNALRVPLDEGVPGFPE
jgi:alkylhydroperoxidase family enzyme